MKSFLKVAVVVVLVSLLTGVCGVIIGAMNFVPVSKATQNNEKFQELYKQELQTIANEINIQNQSIARINQGHDIVVDEMFRIHHYVKPHKTFQDLCPECKLLKEAKKNVMENTDKNWSEELDKLRLEQEEKK